MLSFIPYDQLDILFVPLLQDQFLVHHHPVNGRLVKIADGDQLKSCFIAYPECFFQLIDEVPYFPLIIIDTYLEAHCRILHQLYLHTMFIKTAKYGLEIVLCNE